MEAFEDPTVLPTEKLGKMLNRDIEEAKNESSKRLATENVKERDEGISSDDDMF